MLPVKIEENLCMYAQPDKNADITYMHANQKLKKTITIKPSIQIKFEFHHYLSYDKIFKTRPHLPMFARIFKKYLFKILNT